MKVYADNAATMRMRKSAYYAMLPYFRDIYANPSSVHWDGIKANEAVEIARKTIADCIGADPSEIYFTSGATESNNWAYFVASANCTSSKFKILTTKFEHKSNFYAFSNYNVDKVSLLDIPNNGIIKISDFEKALSSDICFVSVMYANNELGTIQPIREIGELCKKRKVIFHTDATQAVGHIPINVERDNIDLLSCSAHKFGGAKGVGFLYCRKGINLPRFHIGGKQEHGKRSGTLNVPGIVSMAVAFKESVNNMNIENEKITLLTNRLINELLNIPNSYLNGDRINRLPNIINIRFDDVESETLLSMLSEQGIMVSANSACSSESMQQSHVLTAIGLSNKQAHESIRISLSHENTNEELDYMIYNIKNNVEYLRKLRTI